MKRGKQKRTPQKRSSVTRDGKPPIVEAGPIIIKSGPDDGTKAAATPVSIESVLYDFSDKDKKKGRKYQTDRTPMKIIDLAYETDQVSTTGVSFKDAKRVKIVITIDPS